METPNTFSTLGTVYAMLARGSNRPKYSFMVLQLVAEIADGRGRAGPFVMHGGTEMVLRDWLCTQLMPMSERGDRRQSLRARVLEGLKPLLSGDNVQDEALINAAVEDQVMAVGLANLSRAISDLVRLGLLQRHYAGYATNHINRGGQRHAVYVLAPMVMGDLCREQRKRPPIWHHKEPQGHLFAA